MFELYSISDGEYSKYIANANTLTAATSAAIVDNQVKLGNTLGNMTQLVASTARIAAINA